MKGLKQAFSDEKVGGRGQLWLLLCILRGVVTGIVELYVFVKSLLVF